MSFGLEALTPAQDPVAAPTEAAAPAEPKGLDGAPGSTPQLSIRLQQEGDHWLVEFEHSDGRRWKSVVPLEEDFATLLRPNVQEAVSSMFLEALQSDWQGLTLRMGQHLVPTNASPDILLTFEWQPLPNYTAWQQARTNMLAVRLDVVPAELRWLPGSLYVSATPHRRCRPCPPSVCSIAACAWFLPGGDRRCRTAPHPPRPDGGRTVRVWYPWLRTDGRWRRSTLLPPPGLGLRSPCPAQP